MPNTIVITKLQNDKVAISNNLTESPDYALRPSADVFVSSSLNGVKVVNDRGTYSFSVVDVEKVVRKDGTEITISDVITLYNELATYFFFDVTGSGNGGTGWTGEVDTFAELPAASDNTGSTYLVKTRTGSQLTLNLKRSGFYQSDGISWTKLNQVQFMFTDDELTFKDSADNTKQLGFELNQITTGTRKTVTWQDKDITVADNADVTQNATDISTHIGDTNNPHSTDIGNLGSGTLAELNAIITDTNLIPDIRQINSVVGETTGGGDLSANRSLGLADTAVTPGIYTLATIEIDSKGRIIDAQSGNIITFINPTLVLTCTASVNLNSAAGLTVPFNVPLRNTIPGISVSGAGVVTLGTAGEYRAGYKINSQNTQANRVNAAVVIRKNGVQDLPLTLTYSYGRNVSDPFSTHSLPMCDDIINMNLLGGETFQTFSQQAGTGGASNSIANQCFMIIEKIS